MLKKYIPNKDYLAIYLHSTGDSIASALFDIFSGAYLYSMGMPLHWILFFFACEFGFRGLMSPLGALLPSRIGVPWSTAIAYFFITLFFFTIAQAEHSLIIAFFAFIFHSIARGIYYPSMHAIRAIYVDKTKRGKQASFESVLKSFATIIGVGLGSILLTISTFQILAIIATGLLIISLLPYIFILSQNKTYPKVDFWDSFKVLKSIDFRENILPFSGHALVIIMNSISVPLFIFIIAQSFETMGIIMTLIIAIETIIILLFGEIIDHSLKKKSLFTASLFQSLSSILFLIFAKTPFSVFLTQAYNKISYTLFSNSINAVIYQKMSIKPQPFVFAAAKEMTLCFSEFIFLSIFAIIAYFYQTLTFSVIFISGFLGLILVNKYFKITE